MIREFWVENFLSIKTRQIVNFETKNKEDEWASVDCGGDKRVNKLAVIYGANASGKSNLLFAIQNVFELLFLSQSKRTSMVHSRKPFALCPEKPTRMYVSFYASGVRYDYEIEYNQEHIISEKMDWYPNKSKILFYERHLVSDESQVELKFGPSLGISSKTKDVFLQNTLNNHSVLSTFEKTSFEPDAKPIADLYRWMALYMHEVNVIQSPIIRMMKKVEADEKLKHFFLQLLNKADFNIVGFHTETITEKVPVNQLSLLDESVNALEDGMAQVQKTKLYFEHGAGRDSFIMELNSESQGTKKMISNLFVLYKAITENHIFLLDEIDSELHDDLLLFYLNTFVMNSNGSQLIFTTQEMSLLHEDLLNGHRDFVFFTEKNRGGAYSEYTRADGYGLHKNLSLYNSYKAGRLGALPQLGSPLLYLENDEED